MGYRFNVDRADCLNCGVCMDVCPVQALDMTRPAGAGVEASGRPGSPFGWMMEYPIQVGECIGCGICERECPTHVVAIAATADLVPLAARQGPVFRPGDGESGAHTPDGARHSPWLPLGDVTRESLKPVRVSPWGAAWPGAGWRTSERPADWQVWRTMISDQRVEPQAPCQAACPAGTDAGRYVGLIAAGRYDEAFAVAGEVNPFASACGWICTAPCESVCRRGTLDEPIAIRRLKRFAAEQATAETRAGGAASGAPSGAPRRASQQQRGARKRSARVAIVGGGPAGMSAAWFLARLGYPVTVFEAMPVAGGMMAIGIPEYRLPKAVLRAEIDRILDAGVELKLNAAMGRDFTLADLERQYAAVFLATGASRSRRLGVPGDSLPGVVPATVFLKQVNLGEPVSIHGHVVVVGGGSTAMDAARSALRAGAASVTVLYRRGRADMPAQHEEVEAAEHEGIRIQPESAVVEVRGNGHLAGVRYVAQRPTGTLDAGRPSYEPIPGSERELRADTVLVAVGEEPDPSILPEGAGIETSGFSGIVADASLATGRRGVFAGGDVVSGAKTIIHAVAAGRRAAASIHEYLSGAADGEAEIFATVRVPRQPEPTLDLDLGRRPRPGTPLPVFVPGSFAASQPGLEPGTARAEAARCFRCDAVYSCESVRVSAGRGPADRPSVNPTAGGSPPGVRPASAPPQTVAASASSAGTSAGTSPASSGGSD